MFNTRKRNRTARRRAARRTFFVQLVLEDRAYGGAEEGGWWYNTSEPVGTPIVCHNKAAAEHQLARLCAEAAEANQGRRPISSVLSEGIYRAEMTTGAPPERYPTYHPYYE